MEVVKFELPEIEVRILYSVNRGDENMAKRKLKLIEPRRGGVVIYAEPWAIFSKYVGWPLEVQQHRLQEAVKIIIWQRFSGRLK